MMPGLQTHIEGRIPMERLEEVYRLGFRLARIAAMECSVEVMLECYEDVKAAGLTPIVTIADPDRIPFFQPGDFIECRNEDDGDLDPEDYRHILDEMAARSQEAGTRLLGGVGSNTSEKPLKWGRDVRADRWPTGMWGLGWHSYGPYPHDGFDPKAGEHPCEAEFRWLRALAGDLPVILTEFGDANTTGVTEEQQARSIAELWKVWRKVGLWGACLFQIHDGADPNNREHRYGIYRADANFQIGSLKPVAYTLQQFPLVGDTDMNSALMAVRKEDLISQGDNKYACWWPHGSDTVLSVQGDGSYETRPNTAIGPWETAELKENKLIFTVAGKTYVVIVV